MTDDRGSNPPPPPPTEPTTGEALAGGGIYFRWDGRLWQEQADGSYFVWDEETHAWEASPTQPPPQQGQVLTTRECPNCGRRVKASLRYCPHCEFGFEAPAPRRAAATGPAVQEPPRKKRDTSLIALVAALVVAVAVGGFVFQQRRTQACDNWRAAVDELTRVTIELQGLPRGTSEAELAKLNEDLLADRRPGGCE